MSASGHIDPKMMPIRWTTIMLQAYFPVTTRLLASAFATPVQDAVTRTGAWSTPDDLESTLLEGLLRDVFADPRIHHIIVRNRSDGIPTLAMRPLHVMAAIDRTSLTTLTCCDAAGRKRGRFTLMHGAGIHLVISCSLNRWCFDLMERANTHAIAVDRLITGLSDHGRLAR